MTQADLADREARGPEHQERSPARRAPAKPRPRGSPAPPPSLAPSSHPSRRATGREVTRAGAARQGARRPPTPSRSRRSVWTPPERAPNLAAGYFSSRDGFAMSTSLHLLKLCVGADGVDDLVEWQAARIAERARGGPGAVGPFHVTRMWPKREAELVAGGSLYWVFKGLVLARQRILGARAAARARTGSSAAPSGSTPRWSGRCRSRGGRFRAGATCGRRTRRATWCRRTTAVAEMPPRLVAELAEIGVL